MQDLFFKPIKKNNFWYIEDNNGKLVSLNGKVFRAKSVTKVADKIADLQFAYEESLKG
ncbi:hypothetical protein KUA24_132 [Vibrio phage HNL01]|nr:hypothetical protein KUA24_132 [Vibrio phage HNL01]